MSRRIRSFASAISNIIKGQQWNTSHWKANEIRLPCMLLIQQKNPTDLVNVQQSKGKQHLCSHCIEPAGCREGILGVFHPSVLFGWAQLYWFLSVQSVLAWTSVWVWVYWNHLYTLPSLFPPCLLYLSYVSVHGFITLDMFSAILLMDSLASLLQLPAICVPRPITPKNLISLEKHIEIVFPSTVVYLFHIIIFSLFCPSLCTLDGVSRSQQLHPCVSSPNTYTSPLLSLFPLHVNKNDITTLWHWPRHGLHTQPQPHVMRTYHPLCRRVAGFRGLLPSLTCFLCFVWRAF